MSQLSVQQVFDLAMQRHTAGRLTEAETLYRQILVQHPAHVDALHYLGVISHQMGRHDLAIELMRKAVMQRPDDAAAHGNLGMALRAKGLLDEAISHYRLAIARRPNYAEAYSNLGIALKEKGQFEEAIAAHRQAIAQGPTLPQTHSNFADSLRAAGRLDEAIAECHKALALDPRCSEARRNLAASLGEKGLLDETIEQCRQAILLRPDSPEAHYNLGVALAEQGKLEDAADAYRKAIALKPAYARAHNNLGIALRGMGRLAEAIVCCRQATLLNPDLAEAHYNLGYALLSKGDFAHGWDEYAWRWKCKDGLASIRSFPQPQWDGRPIDGQTLLLHAEQGLGDSIQFIRYVRLAAARCGKVIVECRPELHRLFQKLGAGGQTVSRGQTLPAFDCHCPLLTLPRLFETTLSNIPADIPYLNADPQDVAKWGARVADASGQLKVGLAWAGNPDHIHDRERSLPFTAMESLSTLPNVRWFSIQKGEASKQASGSAALACVDWTDDLQDFADTAGLIANLDLVISVDTAVAHLAGAMGKPVWTLLPFAPDWRWLQERDDSPWYPTMKLFRQTARGDWKTVISRVSESLKRQLSAHSPG